MTNTFKQQRPARSSSNRARLPRPLATRHHQLDHTRLTNRPPIRPRLLAQNRAMVAPNPAEERRTFTLHSIAQAYGWTARTTKRRMAELEARGLIVPIDAGGGRGKVKTYDAKDVRRLLRQAAAPLPELDDMPAPIGFAEWSAQWATFRRWQADRARRLAAAAADNQDEEAAHA